MLAPAGEAVGSVIGLDPADARLKSTGYGEEAYTELEPGADACAPPELNAVLTPAMARTPTLATCPIRTRIARIDPPSRSSHCVRQVGNRFTCGNRRTTRKSRVGGAGHARPK